MKKITLAFCLFSLCTIYGQAPENENTDLEKISLGNHKKAFFIKGDQQYKLSEYKEVFTLPEAVKHIKKARTNKTFAEILTYTGSFGFGFGLAQILFTKSESEYQYSKSDKNTGAVIMGVGAGLIGTSIPLWIGYNRNIKKAVDIENGKQEQQTFTINYMSNANGTGVSLVF